MIKKQLYAAPTTEVLELRLEGVIATSDPELRGGVNANFGSGFTNTGGEEDITW